jgi:hypothetical protein
MDFAYKVCYNKPFLNVKRDENKYFMSSIVRITSPNLKVNIKISIAISEPYHRLYAISNFYVQKFG